MNRFIAAGGGKMPNDRIVLTPESAATLDGLFRERVKLTPDALAYKEFDEAKGEWREHSWKEVDAAVARWQAALEKEQLRPGDRVALQLRNCVSWVVFDQAAMGLGLVTVPLYTQDRPDNVAYIIKDCGAKLLLVEKIEHWKVLEESGCDFSSLQRVLCLGAPVGNSDARVRAVADWLSANGQPQRVNRDSQALASIIYTSGTTGRPKGVMLSHHNMLSNAHSTLTKLAILPNDIFLSFLPLSHTFERTVGYYLAVMAGIPVAYARSIAQLAEDLGIIKPTLLISVPRIYERVYAAIKAKLDEGSAGKRKLFAQAVEVGYSRFERSQGRAPWRANHLLWPVLKALVAKKVLARLGGRLRAALSGGAALPPEISRVFIGLGLPVLQGYGLTETSPVVCANSLEDNVPASIGKPIPGVEVKLGEKDALLVKGPNVMLGYWNNPDATKAMFTADGWLNTGDTARIDSEGRVYITGRLKEIIVLSNGEKIPPVDMETAILRDPLFEQVLVLGEARPYLSVMAVLNQDKWNKLAAEAGIASATSPKAEAWALQRIAAQIKEFPGYAQVRQVALITEPWTVENGMLTPTMKLKRTKVLERHRGELEKLYAGH
ncbi:MAG TPA: long-chain fatty acid--CoA ligase [Burkholderiales bacterium]|nr:long-chain fatty acid--CoA ligase [Burkholderiales bacterium]